MSWRFARGFKEVVGYIPVGLWHKGKNSAGKLLSVCFYKSLGKAAFPIIIFFDFMIIVIADDITGAAEIAGIALKHGLETVLTTEISLPETKPEVLVFATDTRSGNKVDAGVLSKKVAEIIPDGDKDLIFKKTDSVLRGHIVTELGAIMEAKGFGKALLLPQNPSKGRVIRAGVYYINDVPLDQTDFNRDPEFPATSSRVKELLEGNVETAEVENPLKADGKKTIFIADAEDKDDIIAQLDKADENTLLAGGADLFTALVEHKYNKSLSESGNGGITVPRTAIIICGSTQSKNITEEPFIKSIGAREEIMPYDVFRGEASPEGWFCRLSETYKGSNAIIISIGTKENGGKECAVRLRKVMAEATCNLVGDKQPDLIIIEGGATAYAILSSIGWNSFNLKREYAPGIVGMEYKGTEIILKPGSYPWGNLFKDAGRNIR